MIIDYSNTYLSKRVYEHDCIFSGFTYDYEDRSIQFEMINWYDGIEQSFKLNNVILFNMQSCSFWHGGNAVYYVRCCSEHPFFQHLDVIQHQNQNNVSGSYLDMQIKYIVFELQINSGDMLLAICESVDYSKCKISTGEGSDCTGDHKTGEGFA